MNNLNEQLWQIIAEIGIKFHPERVFLVAREISKHKSISDINSIHTKFGPNDDRALINNFQSLISRSNDVSPNEIASALITSSFTSEFANAHGKVEMVWTGPGTGMIPIRHTEQILIDVINAATRELFIVSFVAYKVDSIIASLKNAVARHVKISFLLEKSSDHGGKVSTDSIGLILANIPTANIYCWEDENGESLGTVHAKCAVADGEVAFITSANLTGAAMRKNMELGVFVNGGTLPKSLNEHLKALASTRIIRPINSDS